LGKELHGLHTLDSCVPGKFFRCNHAQIALIGWNPVELLLRKIPSCANFPAVTCLNTDSLSNSERLVDADYGVITVSAQCANFKKQV
jgi:hypothetical protein